MSFEKESLRWRLSPASDENCVLLQDSQPQNDLDITDTVRDLIDAAEELYWKSMAVLAEDEAPDYLKGSTSKVRELLKRVGVGM